MTFFTIFGGKMEVTCLFMKRKRIQERIQLNYRVVHTFRPIHLATKQIFTTLCLNTSLRQFPHELEEYFYAKIHNLTTGRKEIQKNVCQF